MASDDLQDLDTNFGCFSPDHAWFNSCIDTSIWDSNDIGALSTEGPSIQQFEDRTVDSEDKHTDYVPPYQAPSPSNCEPATGFQEGATGGPDTWQHPIDHDTPAGNHVSDLMQMVERQVFSDLLPVLGNEDNISTLETRIGFDSVNYLAPIQTGSSEQQNLSRIASEDVSGGTTRKRRRIISPNPSQLRQVKEDVLESGSTMHTLKLGTSAKNERKRTATQQGNRVSVTKAGGQCLPCIRSKNLQCNYKRPCEPCCLRMSRNAHKGPRYTELGCVPSNLADFFLPDEKVTKEFAFGSKRTRSAIYESIVDMFDGFESPPVRSQLRLLYDIAGLVGLHYNPNHTTYLCEFEVFKPSACSILCAANILCHPNNKHLDLLHGKLLGLVMVCVYHAAVALIRLLEQTLRRGIKLESEFSADAALRFAFTVCRTLFTARHLIMKHNPERPCDVLSRFTHFYKVHFLKLYHGKFGLGYKDLNSVLEITRHSTDQKGKNLKLRLKPMIPREFSTETDDLPRRLDLSNLTLRKTVDCKEIYMHLTWVGKIENLSHLHQALGVFHLAMSKGFKLSANLLQFEKRSAHEPWQFVVSSSASCKLEPKHYANAPEQAKSQLELGAWTSTTERLVWKQRDFNPELTEGYFLPKSLARSLNSLRIMMELALDESLSMKQVETFLEYYRSSEDLLAIELDLRGDNVYYAGAEFLLSQYGKRFWKGWWNEAASIFDIGVSIRLYSNEPDIWNIPCYGNLSLTPDVSIRKVLSDAYSCNGRIEDELKKICNYLEMCRWRIIFSWSCPATRLARKVLSHHEVDGWIGCSTCLQDLIIKEALSDVAKLEQEYSRFTPERLTGFEFFFSLNEISKNDRYDLEAAIHASPSLKQLTRDLTSWRTLHQKTRDEWSCYQKDGHCTEHRLSRNLETEGKEFIAKTLHRWRNMRTGDW